MQQVCQSFFVALKEKASGVFLKSRLMMLKNKEYKK